MPHLVVQNPQTFVAACRDSASRAFTGVVTTIVSVRVAGSIVTHRYGSAHGPRDVPVGRSGRATRHDPLRTSTATLSAASSGGRTSPIAAGTRACGFSIARAVSDPATCRRSPLQYPNPAPLGGAKAAPLERSPLPPARPLPR
jgi:hypothetical protein